MSRTQGNTWNRLAVVAGAAAVSYTHLDVYKRQGLEILFMMLPKKAVKAVMLLVQAATAAFMVFLIVMGYKTAGLVWNQTTPVLKMPMGLMYASIPTEMCIRDSALRRIHIRLI